MFNLVKTISISALTAIALAGAVSTPAFADHQDNHQTRQHRGGNNDALVGGAFGAILGGVIGSEVAGSGNGTEGAIVGALVGGLAGAAIADDGGNRRYDDRRSNSQYRSGYNDYDNRRYGNSSYGGQYYGGRSYGSQSYGYSNNRFGSHSSFGRSGFNSHRGNSRHSLRRFGKY